MLGGMSLGCCGMDWWEGKGRDDDERRCMRELLWLCFDEQTTLSSLKFCQNQDDDLVRK